MRKKHTRRVHTIGTVLFLLYLAGLVYFLFFAEGLGRMEDTPYRYNLVPLREILRFYNNVDVIGYRACFLNVAGNVLAFIPFGFFLPLVTRLRSAVVVTTLLTMAFSITIECVQLVTKVGCLDVDDVILNTLGGLIGAILFAVLRKIYRALFGRRRH